MSKEELQICTRGVWNTTVPGITFDNMGVSNYAKMFDNLCEAYPRGEKGKEEWIKILEKIQKNGKGKRYDCIIGVSGGTDSCYLLHYAKTECGLRPLAVNLDNGWNSNIAVQNIKKVTKVLGIDLETYVINYETIKGLLRAYMRAGLPWIDNPTDIAILSVLYTIANKENVKYILVGNDFRTEGKQPSEWTYSDQRQLRYINRKFGSGDLRTYPIISLSRVIFLGYIKGIRLYYPYNYSGYQKKQAREKLIDLYGWKYYGEHHHENIFTKWAIGYWMYIKFGIDKRIITYSAQVLSGEITRDQALEIIKNPPYTNEESEKDKEYVKKKLEISDNEFEKIWNAPNRSYQDYPSSYKLILSLAKYGRWFLSRFLKIQPKIFFEIDSRKTKLS